LNYKSKWSIFSPWSPLDNDALIVRESHLLIQEYARAVKEINKRLKTATAAETFRLTQIKSQIKTIVTRLNIIMSRNIKGMIGGYMGNAKDFATWKISQLGGGALKTSFAQVNAKTAEVLADQMLFDLVTANESMLRTTAGFLRATQQQAIKEETINKALMEGVIQGTTRKAVSDTIYKALAQAVGEGQLVTINGRHYDPLKYAELVTRTRMREAASEAIVNTSLEYGSDLVQVSLHEHDDQPGDSCPEFAGKIFSISGQDADFPPLDERPPFHPRCRHVLLPVVREALKLNGSYEKLVDFSTDPEQSIDSLKQYERRFL